MGRVDPQGLPCYVGRHIDLPLQIPPARPGRPGTALSEEIAETRMRYSYRRVHVVLQREGWRTNIKRTYRLYTAQGLQLRNKTPRRRVKAKLREDRCPASQPNQTWAMDFVHDQLAMGKKIRVLTVVDIFSKFSPVVDPRFSYRAEDVVMTLERVCRHLGYPRTIRVDQGSEFVSRDLDLWAYAKGVTLDFSRPGKPTDTDVVEKVSHGGHEGFSTALIGRDASRARQADVKVA